MTEENSSDVSDITEVVSDDKGTEETVSVASYKRAITQRKNDQAKVRSLQEELDQFKTERDSQAQQKLEADGEFKKINELLKQEIEQVKSDNGLLASNIQNGKKKSAFYNKLEGRLKKLAYESFIDLEEIAIDPTTQEVDAHSVELSVKNFLAEYGDLVEPKNVKTLPGNASHAVDNLKTNTNIRPEDSIKNSLANLSGF